MQFPDFRDLAVVGASNCSDGDRSATNRGLACQKGGQPVCASTGRSRCQHLSARCFTWRNARAAMQNVLRWVTAPPFPQLRALAGSNPRARPGYGNGPVAGAVAFSWWAMRDSVGGWRRQPSLRRPSGLLARCAGKALARFPRLCALAGSNPRIMSRQENGPVAGAATFSWWAMRDSNPQPCACKAPALTVAPIARGYAV